MNRLLLPAIAAATLLLQGCFTGVESTPRISAGDVRRVITQPDPEESYFDSVTSQPFSRWQKGKEFYVTDSKIRLLFGTTLPDDVELAGDTIRFQGFRQARSVTGTEITDLLFTSRRAPGDTLAYRVATPAAELLARETAPDIPFTIEESVVDSARAILSGKTFYILTRNRRTADDIITPGKRFIAVTIDSVSEGTAVNPVRIAFTDADGRSDYLLLASGGAGSSSRKFASMLSFTDPRHRYPTITDANWELICNGKVDAGMTREECRLAWGNPTTIDRRPGNSYLYERWSYDSGIYLIFEDGLLTGYSR